MTDSLVARLREAIDAEEQDVYLSISIEIESLLADGGTVMTREEILAYDAEEEGGGPYTRRLRRCAADRKILDLHADWHNCTQWDDSDYGRDVYAHIGAHEVCDTVKALAEAYGDQATSPND